MNSQGQQKLLNAQEQALREKLGIPDTASIVLIMEQSSHMDWDWDNTFLGYYTGYNSIDGHQPVCKTFDTALNLVQTQKQYYYTFCEMAFLKQYLQDNPSQINTITNNKDRISISGGGVTSAENLICHGEAFIRNYLLGRKWAMDTIAIAEVNQMWLPDDFGFDNQLPILLQAMGYEGVGFARIPIASQPYMENCTSVSNSPDQYLRHNKELDFVWMATDGSQVQAHWLAHGYQEGNNLYSRYDKPFQQCDKDDKQCILRELVCENLCCTNTDQIPYMFVPIDDDFCAPYEDLLTQINNWNSNSSTSGSCDNCSTNVNPQSVYIVAATFDSFIQLVNLHTTDDKGNSTLRRVHFGTSQDAIVLAPNPYYSGCYGSRPDLKLNHYETARMLLAAEAFEVIIEYLAGCNESIFFWTNQATGYRQQLTETWTYLMPSTHHDFVTGTSPDDVYGFEQSLNLLAARQAAASVLEQVLSSIAKCIKTNANTGEQAIAIFNPIGIDQSGLVEINSPDIGQWQSVRTDERSGLLPIQRTVTGAILFIAQAPSFGYSTVYLSTELPGETAIDIVSCRNNGDGTFTLANGNVKAVISSQGIVSFVDSNNVSVLKGIGNQLAFYYDQGGLYRFGNEVYNADFYDDSDNKVISFQNPILIENGPLRVKVQVNGILSDTSQIPFQIIYSLVAGESCLRISTTGAAPSCYSVMVRFSFNDPITSLTHGTTYHWDTGSPRQFVDWKDCKAGVTNKVERMTFEACHSFVIPQTSDSMNLAAIYHASTPGWAIDGNGNMLGCLLRNTPGQVNAAHGTDFGQHTADYAIRIPSGLNSPVIGGQSGGPLGEALKFNNPLIGMAILPVPALMPTLPSALSIASTQNNTSIITALKMGTIAENELILRIYQPTNDKSAVEVELNSCIASHFAQQTNLQVTPRTALELDLDQSLSITSSPCGFQFTAPNALTTLAVSS